MPTKYVRKSYREHALGSAARQHVLRQPRRLSQRQALLLVYLGIGAFVVVLAFSQLVIPRLQFQGQPVLRSQGVLLTKRAVEASAGQNRWRLGIEVVLPDGRKLRGYTVVDQLEGEHLGEGELLVVSYQVSRWGQKVWICGVEEVAPVRAFLM